MLLAVEDALHTAARLSGAFTTQLTRLSSFAGVSTQFDEYTLRYQVSEDLVRSGSLLRAKLAASTSVLCIELTSVLLFEPDSNSTVEKSRILSKESLPAVTALCVIGLQYATHKQRVQSSTTLAIWLAFSILMDIALMRRMETHLSYYSADFLVASASAMLKTLMLLLDEMPKHNLIYLEAIRNTTSYDSTMGFFSRLFVLWFSRTFFFGFRHNIGTGFHDDLDPEYASNLLLEQFSAKWAKADKGSRYAFIKTYVQILWRPFLTFASARMLSTCFLLLHSLLLRYLVCYVFETYLVDHNRRIASELIGFGVIIHTGILLSKSVYMHLNGGLEVSTRGLLVAAVYRKSLFLPEKVTLNNRPFEQTTIISVVSGDIPQIVGGFSTFTNLLAAALECCFCICFLGASIGKPAFLAVLPAILIALLRYALSGQAGYYRNRWSETSDVRVTHTSTMLSQIKAIKMTGLDVVVADEIRRKRADELGYLTRFRAWVIASLIPTLISMHLTPPLVLIGSLLWSMREGKLTPTDAFTTLGILAIISNPTHILPPLLSEVRSALASAETIQAYLLATEVQSQNSMSLVDLRSNEHSDQGIPQPENETKFSKNLFFELRDASLSIAGEVEPILQHVNMVVCEGVVLTVVGHNGSGKSTILRSITGDTRISGGLRYKQHLRVAYCGQTPWLPNKSIRRTIVAYNDLNAEWYSAVLDACLLIPDLRSLIKRDHTIISNNGANLSGGQKQRIALARAVYCKAPMLVLDDIFSSLDRPTAMEIQRRLFGPYGILRRLSTTIIVSARSSADILFTDQTLFIDIDGSTEQRQSPAVPDIGEARLAVPNDAREETPEEDMFNNADTETLAIANKKKDAERTIDWSLCWFYIESFAKAQFVFCIVVYFVASLLEVSPAVYVGMWLELPLSNSDVYSNSYIIFCVVMTVLLNGSTAWWTICMLPASSEKLHEMLLGTTLDATLHFLTSKAFSHVLALVASNKISELYLKHYLYTSSKQSIVGIVVSCSMYAVWSYPILVFAVYFIQGQYLRVIGPLQSTEIDSNTAMNVQLTDTTRGLEHIRAFGWQSDNIEEALACLDTSQRNFQHLKTTGQWLSVMLETVKLVSGMLLVLVATCATVTTTGPRIGPSLMVALTMSWEMNDLVSMSAGLLSSLGALRRIREFVNNTPQERKPSAKERATIPKDWPQHGEVIMSEVSAKYDRSETSPAILKDLSFTIAPGQKVGIVGRTGSGKTSLLMTILNSLEYTGTITIDGIDISKVAPLALRASVTTVSQDFIEFDNTIRFNLCPWTMNATTTEEGNVNEAAVIKLLEMFNLWRLAVRHGGLDAKMSDLGLSNGQKQAMCIIRACLHKLSSGSRLVIMDESTSALDDDMMEAAKDAMKTAFWDCTIITVAHRPEALEEVDMILYMRDGRIVRQESPGVPAPPPPRPIQPQGPVAMTPFFKEMLQKSLRAEAEIAAGLHQT